MIKVPATIGVVLALIYNMWIAFRVIDGWFGLLPAIVAMVLFPVTTIILPIVMFFIPSADAGVFAMWPGIIFIGLLARFAAG